MDDRERSAAPEEDDRSEMMDDEDRSESADEVRSGVEDEEDRLLSLSADEDERSG